MVARRRYELGERIGDGGFAEVFRAVVAGEDRQVAVKRMFAGSDRSRVAFTMREALIGAKLDHPNIVAIDDWYWDRYNRLCLVSELIDGFNLADVIKRAEISVDAAVYIAGELADALAYAYDTAQVIHYDMSPHNVLISWDGAVKLTDFGIARPIVSAPTTGVVHGKLPYIAPEHLACVPLDARADLYGLGVTLYQMLTRQLPPDGLAENPHVIPPRKLRPEVSRKLDALIRRMIARNRDKRPAHAPSGARGVAAV